MAAEAPLLTSSTVTLFELLISVSLSFRRFPYSCIFQCVVLSLLESTRFLYNGPVIWLGTGNVNGFLAVQDIPHTYSG